MIGRRRGGVCPNYPRYPGFCHGLRSTREASPQVSEPLRVGNRARTSTPFRGPELPVA
jgi:hypothetical protein